MTSTATEEVGARPSRAAAQSSVVRYVAMVVVGVAILQALWIAVVPPFRGIDEFDHAFRAAAVAGGQFRASEAPADGRGLLVEVPVALVRAAHDQCEALRYTGPDNCSPVEQSGEDRVLVASGAASYNPDFYWVIGNVSAPFSGVAALYAMRVISAALCLLFIGAAAWAVAVRRGSKWSRVGLVVACTPVMLYSTSLPAPNGLEMSVALAFWCSLLALDGSLGLRHERSLLVLAAVSGAVLMVDRSLGPLFAVLAIASVWLLRPTLVRRVLSAHRRWFVAGSLVVIAAAASAAAWILTTDSTHAAPAEGSEWNWSALLLWPLQAIAAFPFRDQAGAVIVYPVVIIIFGVLVAAALKVGSMRERSVIALTMVLSAGVPLLLTWLTYSDWGAIWQGRYGLPYSMGIVLVGTFVLDAHSWSPRLQEVGMLLAASLMSVSTAACYGKVVRQELLRAPSATDPSWHVPGYALLVLGSMAAWALLYLAVVRNPRGDA